MGEPKDGLVLEGWRREVAKRPIETRAHRRAWDDLLKTFYGAKSGDIATLCGVSRQTASAWLNHPEETLTWARFDEIAQAVYDYIGAHPGEVRPKRFGNMGYGAVTQDDVQFLAEVITGSHDAEDRAVEEAREGAENIMGIYVSLDEGRRLALQRVALDMLAAQRAERGQR